MLGCSAQPERANAQAATAGLLPTPVAVRAPAAEPATELVPGTPVPDVPFTLQDGFQFSLPSMKGKFIAVYFCAAHDDPDCVREMKGLRDHWHALHEQNHVVIIGVSPADAATHRAFIAKHNIPFDLAADGDGTLARAFGVPEGFQAPRTFLMSRDGKVRSVWRTASPDEHTGAILTAAGS